MANNNNEGADNNPDNSKDSGLDKSLVGKFMSGIINSTPLSKWFGKDSKSTVRRREEDDEFDNSYVFQPPSKRAKLPLDIEHNNYSAHVFESPVIVHNASNNVNNVSSKVFTKFPEPAPGPSGIKSRNLFRRHDTASTNSVSINSSENQVDVVNGDNDSDSEESTSGYSSAPKLVNKEKSGDVFTSKEVLEKHTPKSRSLFTSTNDSGGGRSLFTEKSPQMNTSLSSRRPSFNASTFGSPNFVDRTLSTKRILSSPFYSGHTIYGGASAYGRKLAKSTEDLSASARVQIKPVNKKATNENATLSKTARRILNTLEQYSTPINDAKKIPVAPRKPGLLTTYVGATPYLVRDRKKPSNKELQVPTIPDLLQMKQKERLQNSTETVRQIATHSKSSLNKEYKIRTEEDNKQKRSNKMKSNVTSVRQKSQPIEPLGEVKLPKVSLPITTLPKFDFVLMPPNSSSETNKNEASKSTTMIKSPVSTITKPSIVVDRKETEKKNVENVKASNYIFSEPLVVSKEMKPVTGINCFKFSEPLCKKTDVDFAIAFKSSDDNFKTDGCRTKNNGENISFSKPSSQLFTGSVMDVLGNKKQSSSSNCDDNKMTESTPVTSDAKKNKCSAYDESKPEAKLKNQGNNGFGDQFKLSSDKWECGSCMVRNNNSDKKCVACGAAMPNDNKPIPKSTFGDKFKPPASTWECTSCLIRNKNELNNCAACNAAKSVKDNVVSGFGDNFKPSSDTWECGTCMIRNKNDVTKCVACETPKTGSKTTTTQKSEIFASTGEYAKPTFSFGIKEGWKCKTCLINNKNDSKKCAACEMPRESSDTKKTFGAAFKMKDGKWECTSCMVKNKPATDVCVCCGVAKAGASSEKLSEISKTEEKKPVISFNFGIDKSSSTQFKFGIPTEIKETSVGVTTTPAFSLGDPSKTNTVSSSGFTFGINTQENRSPTKSLTSTSESTAQVIAGNPLLKPNEKLPEKATPAPAGFKFGIDGSLNKKQADVTTVSSSNNKSELPTSLGSEQVPMFQFKPPAINGDIGKPKPLATFDHTRLESQLLFPGKSSNPKVMMFRGKPSKPKESFSSDLNKSHEAPFGSKSTDSPFGGASKLTEPGFSNNKAESSFVSMGKPAESLFSNVSKNATPPFADDKKATDSPFGPASKPVRPTFGNVTAADKPQESLFGASKDVNKPHATLFGNVSDASKPQETLFVADANKPKDVLFGNKSSESGNLFSTPTSTPTFTFNPKPVENTTAFPPPSTSQSAPPAAGIFKFGDDTSLKRTFGDAPDNNMSNGLGSAAKIPAFGGLQCFAPTENKPFAFSSESAAKSSGFSFGQTDNKPNTTAPVFNFGNSASGTPSTGFTFSGPSSGFSFGGSGGGAGGGAGAGFGSAGNGAKNGSFNFGTNANNNNQKAVFSFGANQTSQPTQPSFPTQNQAGFNFGAPAPQNPPPGNFNFAGAPPSFSFTDGNSATAPPQRKIKKALRRTQR